MNRSTWYRVALSILAIIGTLSCNVLNETPLPTETLVLLTYTPIPTSMPSVLQEGESLSVDNLAITLVEHKLEGCYTSKSDNEICPPSGAVLLWIHFKRENRTDASDLPIYSCFWFHLLYREEEIDSLSYHSYGAYHPERDSWIGGGCKELYGGHSDEGWIVFEVPIGIVLNQATLRVQSYQGPEFEQSWKLEG
jgi:hypothetical protein